MTTESGSLRAAMMVVLLLLAFQLSAHSVVASSAPPSSVAETLSSLDEASPPPSPAPAVVSGTLAITETITVSTTLTPTVENIKAYITVVFTPLGPEAVAWGLRVAKCESWYDPRAVNRRGNWHGLYQYHPLTWAKVSGGADIYDWQAQTRATARLYSLGQQWHWACR